MKEELLELLELEELALVAVSDELLWSELLPASPAKFRLLFSLKSVSYQPPPFRRNPAAEISLFSFGAPHSGQIVSGSSDIF